MRGFTLVAASVVVLLLGAGIAWADVTVTNKASASVEVKIGNGSKTAIKSGEKAIFNNTGGEVKVTVYASGGEKATATVKNNTKVIVAEKNGVWTITPE